MATVWVLLACVMLSGAAYGGDITALQRKVVELETKSQELRQEFSSQNATVNFITNIKGQPYHEGSVVHFYAARSDSIVVWDGGVIPWDKVWYNSGQFNPDTGAFICPTNGVYVFSYNLAVKTTNYLSARLYVGEQAVAITNAPINPSKHGHNAHATITISCNKYQDVRLVVTHATGVVLGNGFTHFSGFLLLTI